MVSKDEVCRRSFAEFVAKDLTVPSRVTTYVISFIASSTVYCS